jgi:hypothetical protein
MNQEFILIAFNQEIDFIRDLISQKAAQGSSREEINNLLEIIDRLERLRSRFLERC